LVSEREISWRGRESTLENRASSKAQAYLDEVDLVEEIEGKRADDVEDGDDVLMSTREQSRQFSIRKSVRQR
jgi:hypothetical protein